MIQAILFDCDGVIADSEMSWNLIDRDHLAHYGGPNYDVRYKEYVMGKSFSLADSFYKDRFALEPSLEELVEHRTGVAARYYAESLPIFEAVPEVLKELKAKGLKLALATSSVSRLIRPLLQRHDIERYFDAIITGEMVEHGKPHPDIYLLAAQKCGVEAHDCVVVEDALVGLKAGRSAGATTIAIPDARLLAPALFEGKADYTVTDLRAMLAIVQTLLQINTV